MKVIKSDQISEPSSPHSLGEWKVASPWARLTAQALDQGLVGFSSTFALALWFPHKMWSIPWWTTLLTLWILVSAITQFLFLALYKSTPGKKALKLSLVSARPHEMITLKQKFIRTFTWWLGFATLGSTWTTAMTRSDRRAWHDLASETIVVSEYKGSPHYPDENHRSLGEFILLTASGALALFLVFGVILQLNHLQLSSGKGAFSLSHKLEEPATTMDKNAWLLLGESPSTIADSSLTGDEKRVNNLMDLFSHARRLSLGDRYSFYKTNMEETEDEICRVGFEHTSNCESARLLVVLLSPHPEKEEFTKAFIGLRALLALETAESLSEKIKIIEENIHDLPTYSAESFAFRASEVSLLLRSGQFKRAKDFVTSDLERIHETRFVADEEVYSQNYFNAACEAVALSDCHFTPKSSCLSRPFWRNWSEGCNAADKASSETSLTAEGRLAYWWNKIHKSGALDISEWSSVRTAVFKPTTGSDAFEDNLRQSIFSALDFYVAIDHDHLQDVMGKARKLSPSNPLWGWANLHALDKIGRQWSYLIYPQEQRILIQLEILDQKVRRNVASVEKPALKYHLTSQLLIEK